jgi:methyl-accepting chemotaxis protein
MMANFGRREAKGHGGIEKRRDPRTPVLCNASIILEDSSSRPCLIRDISNGGARLEVQSVLGIPQRFTLRDASGRQWQVLVVQRRARTLGVKFCPSSKGKTRTA